MYETSLLFFFLNHTVAAFTKSKSFLLGPSSEMRIRQSKVVVFSLFRRCLGFFISEKPLSHSADTAVVIELEQGCQDLLVLFQVRDPP